MDPRRLETGFFVVALAAAIVLSWIVFQPYFGVIVIAGTLAFLFRPVYEKILHAFRSESVSALLVVLIVTLIVFVPIGLFGSRIFWEASALYSSFTGNNGFDIGTALTTFLRSHFSSTEIPDIALNLNDSLRQGLTWFIQNLGSFFSGLAQIFFVTFLSLLGLFYFLKDGDRLKKWTIELVPLSREYTEDILREMEAVLASVVRGTLVVAIIQGVIAGVGFFVFGIPEPIFWGAVTVIASLIPVVGTWLVVVPAVAYLFLSGQTLLAVGLAVWSMILVNVVYNVIAPQLMHRGVNMHSYVILLSVLGGITVFGPIGFLMGPLVTAFFFSLLNIYPKLILKK